MKNSKNRSFVKAYLKDKMKSATKYLSEAKTRLKEEAIAKYTYEQQRGKLAAPILPTIAKEVVKRCA